MRNFFISFHSREGSSAIINILAKHPYIHVPIFEELDWMHLSKEIEPPTSQQLAGVLDHFYTSGTFETGFFNVLPDGATPLRDKAIGMKWRMWNIDDTTIPVLRKHRVIVFALERLDIIANCVGGHVSEAIANSVSEFEGFQHIQFTLKENPEAREQLKEIYDNQVVTADVDRVINLLNLKIRQKIFTFKQLLLMKSLGIDVKLITYEDFLSAPEKLVSAIFKALDVDNISLPPSDFSKVNTKPLASKVENWEEVISNPLIIEAVETWAQLMAAYEQNFPQLMPNRE